MLRRLLGIIPLVLLPFLFSCGDDDDDGAGGVGDACDGDFDCRDRCVGGGDWPGGMCTYRCSFDGDCPGGTACVDEDGGVCAVTCGSTDDCWDYGFDSRYSCRMTDRRGEPGDIAVCRGG